MIVLRTFRDWLRFTFAIGISFAVSSLLLTKLARQFEATVDSSSFNVIVGLMIGPTLCGPLLWLGARRWLPIVLTAELLTFSILVIARDDILWRGLGFTVLLPCSLLAFLRSLCAPGTPTAERIIRTSVCMFGFALAVPLFVTASTSRSLGERYLLGSASVLLACIGPLFLEGRNLDDAARLLRITPVRSAAAEAVRGWRWFLLPVSSLGLPLFVVGDGDSVAWVGFLLALPIAVRGTGWAELAKGFGTALAAGCVGYAMERADKNLSGESETRTITALFVLGVLLFLARVVGRVEWERRWLRLGYFMGGLLVGGGLILMVTEVFNTLASFARRDTKEASAIFVGQLGGWTLVFLADRVQLHSAYANQFQRAEQRIRAQPWLQTLVSRTAVEWTAAALMVIAAMFPLAALGTGLWRTKTCKDSGSRCKDCACCDQATPALRAIELDGRTLAVATQLFGASDMRPHISPGNWPDSLGGLALYLNTISLLNGLTPCFVLEGDHIGAANACTGYRLITKREASLGGLPRVSLPNEALIGAQLGSELIEPVRIVRELTAPERDELQRLRKQFAAEGQPFLIDSSDWTDGAFSEE